ncbi:uncharacterized protein TNIN_1772 [Trichonephila inaurata madagascariensis]|uniref:Uncharacterized protein n=1 Tax=Trichonephila inaurata madagascariensis TaxID=2747483 RepID=A0A8X7CLL5_9ARAC|nr:uncharacterized protein TNIN_1772 [Trichonephila inaurata madagascariensis]
MHAYGFLFCVILLSHILVSNGQQKRVPCWTRQKCDECSKTSESRIGQMSLCCEECAIGKLSVRVTRAKAYCWCVLPNE